VVLAVCVVSRQQLEGMPVRTTASAAHIGCGVVTVVMWMLAVCVVSRQQLEGMPVRTTASAAHIGCGVVTVVMWCWLCVWSVDSS